MGTGYVKPVLSIVGLISLLVTPTKVMVNEDTIMTSQAKVYVTQDQGRVNLIPATRFGWIEVVATKDCPTHTDTAAFIRQMEHKLCNFDPYHDFLVLVGDPVVIGICIAILAGRCRTFNVLKWDRQELCYIPITLTF